MISLVEDWFTGFWIIRKTKTRRLGEIRIKSFIVIIGILRSDRFPVPFGVAVLLTFGRQRSDTIRCGLKFIPRTFLFRLPVSNNRDLNIIVNVLS